MVSVARTIARTSWAVAGSRICIARTSVPVGRTSVSVASVTVADTSVTVPRRCCGVAGGGCVTSASISPPGNSAVASVGDLRLRLIDAQLYTTRANFG